MKKWRFFPILVKQEVLKNMDLLDRFSFAKCSKKSLYLLGGVPNLLKSVIITEESVVIDDANFQFLLNDFPFLIACPYSTIEDLSVNIQTIQAKSVLENIIKSRKILKLKSLEMDFHQDFHEFYKELIEICDPSFLNTIKIPRLCTTGIYQSIVNTEKWKSCDSVHLNTDTVARHSSRLVVNYDDFLNFKNIFIGIESFSGEDAWKLVKMYFAFSETGEFELTFRQRVQPRDILTKLDTEMPETLALEQNHRCQDLPAIPGYVLEFNSFHFSFKGRIAPFLAEFHGL